MIKKNYDILSEIIGHMLIDYLFIMINDDHKKTEKMEQRLLKALILLTHNAI